ncbi:MAG: prepilin-type N-terminal cleavage/methylation domain-containing protein [Spirochaetes bacterium]|nr:prepilin-type N-terminal cleavage/methylation domain-containing protein [Spirochaetota bacterium]
MSNKNNLSKLRSNIFLDWDGFTLLELIIVLVIISVITLIVAPRLSVFFSSSRTNFMLFASMIEKTFDDAYLKKRTNFLVLHLGEGPSELSEISEKIFSRKNGISVVNFIDGKFKDSPNPLLSYREFPSSFKLEEVLLSTGEKVTTGNVLIPFYPNGYSDDVIVHIVTNDEKYSFRIRKYQKKPQFAKDFINFDYEESEKELEAEL